MEIIGFVCRECFLFIRSSAKVDEEMALDGIVIGKVAVFLYLGNILSTKECKKLSLQE